MFNPLETVGFYRLVIRFLPLSAPNNLDGHSEVGVEDVKKPDFQLGQILHEIALGLHVLHDGLASLAVHGIGLVNGRFLAIDHQIESGMKFKV